MGYSSLVFLTAMLFSPILLLFALVGFLAGSALRLFDPDVPAAINFVLVALLGLGLLLLYSTVQIMVVLPGRLQQAYLGERVAGPLDLRRFGHEPQIMDPGSEWTYRLSGAEAVRLRRRCPPAPLRQPGGPCLLHSKMGDRIFEEARLTDDGRLKLSELFH